MSDEVDIPFEVREYEHGTRADVFLTRRIKRMSRTRAADLIRLGLVRRELGPPLDKASARVHTGERIVLRRKKLDEGPVDGIEIPIVFEDADVLAVNKPGDLVVHPTASAYHRTLIRILRTRRPGEFLDLAHRIDKETSGLVLLGRSPASDLWLKDQFATRKVAKSYLAVVAGAPRDDRFEIDVPMRLVPGSETGVLMEVGGEGAMEASTSVRVIARGPTASLVEASPHTGRQHQIRVHLMHAGHPLIGDKLYLGGEALFIRAIREKMEKEPLVEALGHWRHALHAFRARFVHPATRREMTLSAPLAPDLVELCKRLKVEAPLSGSHEVAHSPAL